jgi:D-amino-acid dehydrogenase
MESLAEFGYGPGQTATGRSVVDIEPALGEGIIAAFVVESERHVDPLSFTAALLREARRVEVEMVRAPVTNLRRSDGRIDIALGDEPARSVDAVVIAAGAATGHVTRLLGAPLPIEAGKGYCVDIAPPPLALRRPVYLHEERIGVSPMSNRLRLAGTMELGAKAHGLSMTRIRAIERGAERRLRGWDVSASKVTYGSGLRPVTPDGLPVIGPLPGMANVWVASGHAMVGVTLAPATAEVVATGLLERVVPDVVRPFLPARFLGSRG